MPKMPWPHRTSGIPPVSYVPRVPSLLSNRGFFFCRGRETAILGTGPGGIQRLSQGCKEGSLWEGFEAFMWHLSTAHSEAPRRTSSPLFPSLGENSLSSHLSAAAEGRDKSWETCSALTSTQRCFHPTTRSVFSGLGSPSKVPNPSAASHGHHGNPALALRLVLNEDLDPNFIFLV